MLRSLVRQTTHELLNWLLPSDCLLCGTATDSNPAHVPATLCESCRNDLAPPGGVTCESCGAPLGPHTNPAGKCPHCRGRRFRFKTVSCLGMYDGPLQPILLAGKWSTSSNNIRTLARIYIDFHESQLQLRNFDRILPIPQIWHRRLRRNFNAAEIVANEIGKRLDRPVDLHILRRSRATKPQKRASFADRKETQRNSFRIQQKYVIREERLLLVDDILTTGATCDEAARSLEQAGAKECHVAVLARVPSSVS